MRQDSWSLGTWGRIPVTMHWTTLLAFAWMYLVFMDMALMLLSIPFVFFLFVAHEMGHVFILRRKKIAVTGVSLWGIHGETAYNEYAAKPADAVAVAWGGVAAQLLVMLAAIAAAELVPWGSIPFGGAINLVMFTVLVKINIFLMIVALLPIGPFDGHHAWQVIRRVRPKAKVKAKPAPKARPAPPPEPEVELSEERQRELDRSAETETAELIKKLTGRSDASTGDR